MIKFDIKKSYSNFHILDLKKFVFFFSTIIFGFGFNFVLIYFANYFLDTISFGTFYLSLTVLNVAIFAFQPFSFIVIRKLSFENKIAIQNKLSRYFVNLVISYSLSVLFFSIIFLLVLFSLYNIQSVYLYFFLILATTTYFSSEILRNILEAKKMIYQLSLYFFFWCLLKFLLAAFLIFYIKTTFSGIMGIWLGSIIIFCSFFYYFTKEIDLKFSISFKVKYFQLKETIYVTIFYFLIFLLLNLDIILCYFLYTKQILGMYSSSLVIAKGVLVFFNPLMKIFIPFSMSGENNLSFLKSKKTYNIIKLYLILLFFIGVFLIIFTDFYLNSELKFKNTDSYIFKMALISIFPLSIFRLMVMKDFTKFREHRIIYIVVPIIAYIIYIIMSNLSIYDFSRSFVFLSFFVLLYYFVISFLYKFKN
tara:strand:+ start:16973 stop:18232 length:1260 start_codon:yes stop_codon:yes gene_type:complete